MILLGDNSTVYAAIVSYLDHNCTLMTILFFRWTIVKMRPCFIIHFYTTRLIRGDVKYKM